MEDSDLYDKKEILSKRKAHSVPDLCYNTWHPGLFFGLT